MPELLDPTYEPPSGRGGPSRVVKPAIELAKLHPGRWVFIADYKNTQSAASRASGLRNNADRIYGKGCEFAQDGIKVLVRYTPPDVPAPAAPPDIDADAVPHPDDARPVLPAKPASIAEYPPATEFTVPAGHPSTEPQAIPPTYPPGFPVVGDPVDSAEPAPDEIVRYQA